MYVTVRASQVVAGLVFNVLALGIASTVYRRALGDSAGPQAWPCFHPSHPGVEQSSVDRTGVVRANHSVLSDAGAGVLAHFILFRTSFGLALRAAGENPSAADSAGISVYRMRYIGSVDWRSDGGNGGRLSGAGADWPFSRIDRFRAGIHRAWNRHLRKMESAGRRHWPRWCLAPAMRCSCRCNWRAIPAATAGVVTLRRDDPGHLGFVRWQSHPACRADGRRTSKIEERIQGAVIGLVTF